MEKTGKIIVISAPSGCGKSTIIKELIGRCGMPLTFSVSATNRPPRTGEVDGRHYHFMSDADFRRAIDSGCFVEYEEVYPGRFYGTLRSELESRMARGENVLLDIDVKGGCNVKSIYPDDTLTLFIEPPGLEELRRRLEGRATDSREAIESRLAKAAYEMEFAPRYQYRVVNDNLDEAVDETRRIIRAFIDPQ